MSYQARLPFEDLEDELFKLIAEVVEGTGNKQAAATIGVKPDFLSHAVARRKRYRLPAEKLVHVCQLRDGHRIVELLAQACGRQVIESVPPTVEEDYMALWQVLREHLGDEIRKPLLRAQKRRVFENRGLRGAQGDRK